MKTLVVCYSRSGNTKNIGERIASIIGADTDEIIDGKNRSGILGWLGGGRDAIKQASTTIKFEKNPADYELVIIGTPIWVGTAVPAVREYLKENKLTKVAFYCTCGDKQTKAWADMEDLSSKPIATLEIKDKLIKTSLHEVDEMIEKFCEKLKQSFIKI